MYIRPLRADLQKYIRTHGLSAKWDKVLGLFMHNQRHPSLHTELLEPRQHGIFSFRIDRKYRALFFINEEVIEIFQITNHYH